MKQIIQIIGLILLLGACTDEKYSDTLLSGAGESGEPVPVELRLNIQPTQSPFSFGTKAGGNIVSSTEVCKGMEVCLVETPVTRSTTYEDEVTNFWVFQFNGTTPESKLIRKQFFDSNTVSDVELSSQSNKSRIIVIANATEAVFNDFYIEQTLSEFNNLGIFYNDNKTHYPLFAAGVSTPRAVLVGVTDMVVTTGKQADIMLYRSVARVQVNLSLSSDMQSKGYTHWSYQFMNIPEKSFYHSTGRTAAFPGETVDYVSYEQQLISLSTDITSFDRYLPVNLQQPVPFTTPEKRVANAPTKATSLQLVGMKMGNGGVISQSVVYQIHLGSNFIDDYSISPNYSYTYNIKITGESDDDSRVVKFVPGYFGGPLTMYKDGALTSNSSEADTWRYEKQIEVYLKDVNEEGGVKWLNGAGSMPSPLNDLMDGRKNTWNLKDNSAYTAIQKCIGLNAGTPGDIADMIWYMPSYGQSLGIYVAGSSTLKTLPNTYYWSSTANGTFAWGTEIWTGLSMQLGPDNSYNLRCVKDLD